VPTSGMAFPLRLSLVNPLPPWGSRGQPAILLALTSSSVSACKSSKEVGSDASLFQDTESDSSLQPDPESRKD
jgi:hypothetical protein